MSGYPEETEGGVRKIPSSEERWVVIQKKTFTNWCNEQLRVGGRTVENLDTDFCDGVKLVALVEALQFKKIGKVYSKPTSRIQMLQNAALALKAIADDKIRLVNIGTEDVVNGNAKLILGLLWHLILRYQISASDSKAPPKRMMLGYFQGALDGVVLNNFTSDWSDGVALHALIEYCKPGTSPNWRRLDRKRRVENCRTAMQLAKDHLNVPWVISAEDFASAEMDELSAMTYLSYFIKKDSPGYYATLNWVCRQLKTTNVSNLTTDWNDGYYMCAVVQSLGGHIPGWPNLDPADKVNNWQTAIDAAKKMGVEPVVTAEEATRPEVDHLAVMAYLSKFMHITPPLPNSERLTLTADLLDVKRGSKTSVVITALDEGVEKSKVKVVVDGPGGWVLECPVVWRSSVAECSFTPERKGEHTIRVTYCGEEVVGSPVYFKVANDLTNVRFLTPSGECLVGKPFVFKVDLSSVPDSQAHVTVQSQSGDEQTIAAVSREGDILVATFHPSTYGLWTVHVTVDGEEVDEHITVSAIDVNKAFLIGQSSGFVGEVVRCTVNCQDTGCDDVTVDVEYGNSSLDALVTQVNGIHHIEFVPQKPVFHIVKVFVRKLEIRGSPLTVDVVDLQDVKASGEGLKKGVIGKESRFSVEGTDDIEAVIAMVTEQASGEELKVRRLGKTRNSCEFRYLPRDVGLYVISVVWKGRHVHGSPFKARVTDRSAVTLITDLGELKDENDHVVLDFDTEMVLKVDISRAGPGTFTAEMLGPAGKVPVHVNQSTDIAEVGIRTHTEGLHYLHLYWAESPLPFSPILAYCDGPPLPEDAGRVQIRGQGAESARATVEAEFTVDGRKAGPGILRVEMKGVRSNLPVHIHPLKYNRYTCTYTSPYPGGFLLYVYWSGVLVPGCPHKVSITAKGDVSKVKVFGEGLKGGIAGYELKVFVDTREAGPGEVTASCTSSREGARVDVKESEDGIYTLRILPTNPEKHILHVLYDKEHVAESPYTLRIGDPPDSSKVKVFGPGVEDGVIHAFESRFLVETYGAGAGQLAVRIRGPRGGFKVDMSRESGNDRTITCRYDPAETGQYIIHVRWSGQEVPDSPFVVDIVDSYSELDNIRKNKKANNSSNNWRAEI